ncbi:hypothetical protein AbraCBS73388_005018, partial [Aspergillus brasiliensis]
IHVANERAHTAYQRAHAAEEKIHVAYQRVHAAEERVHAANQRVHAAEEDNRRAHKDEKKARKEGEKLRKELELEREQSRRTTFREFLYLCHTLFSAPLQVDEPSRCTRGKIPQPKGKYCPLKLKLWEDCATEQLSIYQSVRKYLEPAGDDAPQLFTSRLGLESMGEYFDRPISSERDVEAHERFTVENQVHKIIAELCKIPAAKKEFRLGTGVRFDSHANCLEDVEVDEEQDSAEESDEESSSCQRPIPDQYCIHQVDGSDSTLILTVEYKPPHKLSVEDIRLGLRPRDFWSEIVASKKIPTGRQKKLEYDAAVLTGSAVVQEYHVMIMNGLEYSYVCTAQALIMLRVPHDDPGTLHYCVFVPNEGTSTQDDRKFTEPLTSVARVLCLCLMSGRSKPRDRKWRERAIRDLRTWTTGFDSRSSSIPQSELDTSPAVVRKHPTETSTTTESSHTEYQPSHASVTSSPTEEYSIPTRSHTRRQRTPDADIDAGPRRQKRRTDKTAKRPGRQKDTRFSGDESYKHATQFCTQRCLFNLQRGGSLDKQCPNVALHRQGADCDQHPISAMTLVQQISQQLDEDVDHGCTPMGCCGPTGALFKITSSAYGYTVVGKGASSSLWRKKISHEADVYRILHHAQGSAVPVFLGTIDLKTAYSLHGAVEINHMLLMAWGGERIKGCEDKSVRREVRRSEKEVRSLGVIFQDLRPENTLWNSELERALIVDFDRSQLDPLPVKKRRILTGKIHHRIEPYGRKRPCVGSLEL